MLSRSQHASIKKLKITQNLDNYLRKLSKFSDGTFVEKYFCSKSLPSPNSIIANLDSLGLKSIYLNILIVS